MNTLIPQTIQQALAHHQAGRLPEAEAIYRQILQADPNHPDALHLLGVIALQVGQNQIAIELIGKAIAINPAASMYCDLGVACQGQGNFEEAAASYRAALALKPDYAEAHNNLGVILQKQAQLDAAVAHYESAIRLKPEYVDAHCNLGNALQAQSKFDTAVARYRMLLELNPHHVEAHYNMGNALQAEKLFDAAIDAYRKALASKPDHVEANYNLAVALQAQGALDAALAAYEKTLSLKPDYVDALNNLGNVLQTQGRLEAAIARYRRAISIKPDYADPYNNLGHVLHAQGKLDESITCYRRALQLKPDFVEAHSNIIFTLDLAASSRTEDLQLERKKWDAAHAAPLVATQRAHANNPDPEKCLRIGYVSADFKTHSAAAVFGGMLVHFDRTRFDVFAYSNTKNEDDLTRVFKQNVTGWRNIVGQSDVAVADLIRQDRIDILVDLSGHSGGNRLLVFARKPAPIQITAWGYATSTGMQAMDVFFADPVIVPPEEKQFFTEEVRYLPNVVTYFGTQVFPDVEALPACSASGITFGSFNRLSKISEQAFSVWTKVLAVIPHSRLILKTAELDEHETRDQVAAHFIRAGIALDRITMLGKTSWHEHVAAFNQVDIGLDPFPHGGGVSTLEGLMMGIPVVTLRWHTIVGRLSPSILTTLGLNDWIAETPEQYVEIAIQKTRDLAALAELRKNLRATLCTSVIGDSAAYARAVEQEYRQLWQTWCVGREVMI